MLETNQHDLARKARELELIHAIDRVRDMLDDEADPQQMFKSLVELLKLKFNADACAILLIAETSEDIEALAVVGAPEDSAQTLCKQAMELEKPTLIEGHLWRHIIGARIVLDHELIPLGGFFIARKERPFDADDLALIAAVESQLDSAVIQARTIWKLAQRNRELEAIYQLDRLRDTLDDERLLLEGFVSILQAHYDADLCMIILNGHDELREIVHTASNKNHLPPEVLEAIRVACVEIQIPQVIPTPAGSDDLLLAAPFIVGGERLGAVVIGRKSPFTIADHRLLFALTSQMDSAVQHSRTRHQLKLRKRELEAIYKIDHIRDQDNDFDDMMLQVLRELCGVINSEMGYLMLYNDKGEQRLELKAMTDEGVLTTPAYGDVIARRSREALDSGTMIYSNEPDGPVKSIIAVPLILNERIIGVFGMLNSTNAHGFSEEDRRMLGAITSQVDTAIFERLERRRMRRVLGRSVDPQVLERLLQQTDDNILAGERVVISVLFADLRGSTEWAERTEPEELVTTLNEFLTMMTKLIFKHGGTLDKFVGDQVIGLFGSPVPMENHAYKIAQCALEMREEHKKLQAMMEVWGKELPPLGIGISSGEVIAGEFGPPIRTDFTAMGRVMNLGARLCGAAGAEEIFISQATYAMIRDLVEVRQLDPLNLKGIHHAVEVYELLGLKPTNG